MKSQPTSRLVVFGGLPGTGKTTVARLVSERLHASMIRIDSIEQAIRAATGGAEIGTAGYLEANRLAAELLAEGRAVLVDCVNPVAESRAAWRNIADRSGAILLEIELVCSNQVEHRRRVESRMADIPGLKLPSWAEVTSDLYETWNEPHLVLDTSELSARDCAEIIALQASSSETGSSPRIL